MTVRRKNRLEYVLKNDTSVNFFANNINLYQFISINLPTKQPSLEVPHEIAQIPC